MKYEDVYNILAKKMDEQEEVHKQVLEYEAKFGESGLSENLKSILRAARESYGKFGTWRHRPSVVQEVEEAAKRACKNTSIKDSLPLHIKLDLFKKGVLNG